MVQHESTSMSHKRIVQVGNEGRDKNGTKGGKTIEKKFVHT